MAERESVEAVFWGETKDKHALEDQHASTGAYIDYMRPRCIELARVLGTFFQLRTRSAKVLYGPEAMKSHEACT